MTENKPDELEHADDRPDRGPWIRLDDVHVSEREDDDGYEVVIEGVNFWGALAPPRVTVGGLPLEERSFASDGRSIRGTLPEEPDSLHVVVDYGFARDELND
jgi:hypothetical protein